MTITEGGSICHSRHTFRTSDCVPPRHRQLICTLEWVHQRDEVAYMSYVTSQQVTEGWHHAIPAIAIDQGDLHSPRPF
ncbi:unnamed protein product [Rotaria sp. Silwood1]|nr:unnamed protein product [Rotaria sp. Silwood1]